MKPHRGVTAPVLGILGIMLCGIFGVVAWVMATNDLREMNQGRMDPSGRDMTNAGRICGMISAVLLAFRVIAGLLVLSIAGGAFVRGAREIEFLPSPPIRMHLESR